VRIEQTAAQPPGGHLEDTLKTTMCLMVTCLLLGCSDSENNTGGSGRFKLEAWADNWFAMYLGEQLIVEDSVSITTERSFNSETFSFDAEYPLHLNFILKDYKQNDTGLEYIGAANQQMGDGGFIAQLTDTSTGKIVGVSSSAWKCTVLHKAPTNKSCEKDTTPEQTCLSQITAEPSGWKGTDYDDSSWTRATEYPAATVSPKGGYNQISWDASAKLI
jgi:hypothetical protein